MNIYPEKSLTELQFELEDLYNKNQTLPRLRKEFLASDEIQAHCRVHGIPVKFAADLLSQMVLHKRAAVSTLVGALHHHFHPEAAGRDYIPTTEQLQLCADMVTRAIETGMVFWDDLSQKAVLRVDVAPEVHEDLERYQYPLPLLIQPKEVKTNRDTGYHSHDSTRGSIILRNNHHDYDTCLDHINRLNRMKLKVNQDTATMIQNSWSDLDHKRELETDQEYTQRVKAFEKYDRVSRDVLQHLALTSDSEFYLTHKYDKRGRTYAQGYHVNPQGNDWSKAIIEFAKPELVNIG